MGSLVLKSLSVLLGLFFVFVGVMKVTPRINRDMHKEIRKEFVRYTKVLPLPVPEGVTITSKWYRRVFGGLEIASGLALAAIPHRKTKLVSNVTLLLLCVLMGYSNFMLNEKFEKIAPSLVFCFMLSCRLLVDWQVTRRDRAALAAAAKLAEDEDMADKKED
ncbi:unnamed protein product [Cyprideis torosa]|uniref:Novel acetylcholine receptor chaperone n=1 Tax=Cyprideis torosa TaxID=163714 RepID=A0A7R8ZR43_9CRUS|nr:unnamed protein product [Cyprideis torosa]CAG0893435.1 unnamed protein product [Cyprideis torosa]